MGIDHLFWLGVSEGSWDVGLTIFAKSHKDFFEMKQNLFQKFRHLILKKDAVIVIYELMFPMKYIHGKVRDPVKIFKPVRNYNKDASEGEVLWKRDDTFDKLLFGAWGKNA